MTGRSRTEQGRGLTQDWGGPVGMYTRCRVPVPRARPFVFLWLSGEGGAGSVAAGDAQRRSSFGMLTADTALGDRSPALVKGVWPGLHSALRRVATSISFLDVPDNLGLASPVNFRF